MGRVLKVLAFLVFGLAILGLLYTKLNTSYLAECALKGIPAEECSLIDKVFQDLKTANVFWLVVICFCFFLSNVSRSLRWQQLSESLGYSTRWLNNFHCVMIGYFANLGLPRIGEVVRAGTFSKYEVVPFEKVVGTVAVDRILDLICFAVVFLLTLALQYELLWSYISSNVELNFTQLLFHPIVIGVVVLGLAATALVWNRRHQLRKNKWVDKVMSMVAGFVEGLKSLGKVKNFPLLVFHTIMIWVMYFLMTYLCFKAFPPTAHLGLLAGLMIQVFGSLGMIIPTPGGMGSYHALVMAGLALYGIDQNDGFSFAMIIFFTINIFGNILFGILALLLLPGYNRDYKPVRPDA